jgi:5-methylcytosine-specific restriction endonuclease McrA
MLSEKRKTYNREYLREWRKQNRDRMRAYDQKWRALNPETAATSDRKKYKKSHDKRYQRAEVRAAAVARTSKWQKANPERAAVIRLDVGHRRRARKYATQVGPINYDVVLQQANGLCGICKQELGDSKTHFDHIITLVRGGGHTQENLQVAHATCNQRKNRRLPAEYEAIS